MELLNPEYRQIVEGNKGTCGMNNFAHLGSPWSGGWVQRTFLKQKFNKTYPNINTTYVFVFVYLFDKTNINNSVENKRKQHSLSIRHVPFWLKNFVRFIFFSPPTRPWELRTRGFTIVGYCCMGGWRLDRI